jgi:3-dehydroquinate synthase
MKTIELHIADPPTPYQVMIGAGLIDQAGSMIAPVCPHDRAMVVCDQAVADLHAARLKASLTGAGYDVSLISIESNEERKSLDTVSRLYHEFTGARLDRHSPVIAVGGGIVGDTAGFAASTFMRGLPFVNVPTTLLAMVDASVGGKTGVNFAHHEGARGSAHPAKNLIGSFYQPVLVIADVNALATLPDRHIRCGLAECIKHAIIGDGEMFAQLERSGGATFSAWDDEARIEFIARNVMVKANIVERDQRESRLRMVLNLGHTYAHAIETWPGVNLWHGEAVALGLIASVGAGLALGITSPDCAQRVEQVVAGVGLATRMGGLPSNDELIEAMRGDKKSHGNRIRLIVPREIGSVEIVDEVSASAIGSGWDRVRK